MRVLIVNTYYYPEMIGGAEHCVKMLAERLRAAGLECAVLCTGEADEDTQVDGVPVYRRRMKKRDRVKNLVDVSKPIRLIHELQNMYCPQNAEVLEPVLDSFRPDVIHTNGLYDISPVIWRCAQKRGVPVVHTLHDYNLLCPRVQLMHKGQTTQCRDPYIWCRAYREINRICSRHVDIVTAPSNKTLTMLRSHGHFRSAETQVVFNAHEYDGSTARQLDRRLESEKDTFTVVYLGELHEKKGLLWLMEEFSRLEDPSLRLVIAGRGPLEEKVLNYVHSDTRIEYRGYLSAEQVGLLLDGSDVLACPSLWEEPFGRVVIDAYKHAMPVISSDMGAFPEIVEDGITGITVPLKERSALGSAIMRLRSDRELWRSCCRNAVDRMELFTMERHVQAYVQLYKKAIGKE